MSGGAHDRTTDDLICPLATPYALHALDRRRRAEIERRRGRAPPEVAEAFHAEVRAVRETMAVIAARRRSSRRRPCGTAVGQVADDPVRQLPPDRRASRWPDRSGGRRRRGGRPRRARRRHRAAADATTSTAEQVFAAPDVHTVSGAIPGGGTATVVFSREKDAGVLVMNNVTPPQPGTVYQMWLVSYNGPHSAGTMDAKSVAPSTTAVLPDLGDSKSLAFTVEPARRIDAAHRPAFAELPLILAALQGRGRRLGAGRRRSRGGAATPVVGASRRCRCSATRPVRCAPCRSRRPPRARAGRAPRAVPAVRAHGAARGSPDRRASPSRPSRAAFQYAAFSAYGASGCTGSPRGSSSSAVITAPRTSAANSTVSATVAGTSATRTSTVGKSAEGRTSQ